VDLPKHQNPVKEKHPLPREIIKAIATTARVEFRNLWQKSTRTFEEEGASSEEGTSLYSLMERAVGITQAHVTRSLEKDDDLVVRDWTTAEIAFYITT
jgi:hypothetical protein